MQCIVFIADTATTVALHHLEVPLTARMLESLCVL